MRSRRSERRRVSCPTFQACRAASARSAAIPQTSRFTAAGGEANVAVDGFEDHSLQGTGGAAFIYYINQGSVQEVAVEVGGQSAEQQSAGIRTNLIPKEGGNRFSGFFFAGFGNHSYAGEQPDRRPSRARG